jgi:Fe-S oxidoreductase
MSLLAESYLGIPGYVIFWLLFAIAAGFSLWRANLLLRLLKMARPENRFDRLAYRFFKALGTFFSQSSNLKSFTFKDPAALGHSLMLWGLMIFGVYCLVFVGLGAGFGLPAVFNGGFEAVFNSILDIVALVVILAMLWVVVKRYIIVPERLKREMSASEKIIQPLLIAVIVVLMALHFGIEGFRYAGYGIPHPASLLGAPLAQSLMNTGISTDASILVYKILWWLNFILLLAAIIYAPRSKHLHPLTSFANLFFRNLAPKGALKLADLKKPETCGAAKIQDFTWKQLLDLYSCTWCGRCHTVCPAQVSGKPLSPRELILGMKEHLLEEGPALLKNRESISSANTDQAVMSTPKSPTEPASREKKLIGEVIPEEAIWACTTCRACQEVCPVSIEHIDKIVDLRRYLQMIAQTEVARDPLKNLRVRGNPWRGAMHARTDWAEGLGIKVVGEDINIDVLFWVGCTEALDDRGLKVAQAVAKLMQQAGVNFGILGEEEMCCGDPARRLGAEHIFQMLAVNNIQLFQSYNIKKIVTACPHCFNTLKNEYPQLGGKFEVIHHTQFIADLLKQDKLKTKSYNKMTLTYQEPCYLGRYNDIYDAPREIINNLHGAVLVEMEQHKQAGFCCGGGGGRMWLEEKTGQRINEMRLDQALATRSQIVATACPFCLQMLEDAAGAKEAEASLKIRDIAEIVAGALDIPGTEEKN